MVLEDQRISVACLYPVSKPARDRFGGIPQKLLTCAAYIVHAGSLLTSLLIMYGHQESQMQAGRHAGWPHSNADVCTK